MLRTRADPRVHGGSRNTVSGAVAALATLAALAASMLLGCAGSPSRGAVEIDVAGDGLTNEGLVSLNGDINDAAVQRLLADAQHAHLVPDLQGASVRWGGLGNVVGVEPTTEHVVAVRQFWDAFLHDAGASSVSLSFELSSNTFSDLTPPAVQRTTRIVILDWTGSSGDAEHENAYLAAIQPVIDSALVESSRLIVATVADSVGSSTVLFDQFMAVTGPNDLFRQQDEKAKRDAALTAVADGLQQIKPADATDYLATFLAASDDFTSQKGIQQ